MTATTLPATYLEAHRYDGAALEHGMRAALEPCAMQPRDVAIVRDVWRYKFLTAPQLHELWWPHSSTQASGRRLLKLFRAGLLDRFRPYAPRGLGSFPWTYHLGEEGHRVLSGARLLQRGHRYRRRLIFDFGHVLHEVQLNAWVLAYRRAVGNAFRSWEGERVIESPTRLRLDPSGLDGEWSILGLRSPAALPVYPDAVVEISGDDDGDESRVFLIEYDRTRRVDKNYDKFERYDALLTWWWPHSECGRRESPPFVVFVCQDRDQLARFLDVADRRLLGQRWREDGGPDQCEFPGRHRVLFVDEVDAHAGRLEARRLPAVPPGHPARRDGLRRVRLGPLDETQRISR